MKSFRHFRHNLEEAAKRSLSRLHSHINSGHMVGFISASRANLSPKENNIRTKQLKKSLIQHGYTPISVKGEYIEDHNGERRPVKEKSFMVHSGSLFAHTTDKEPDSVHSEFLSDMKKHGEQYGQDSVLTVSKKHGSVFHGTGESNWVPKGKRSRIGGAGLKAGPEVEAGDFKSRLAGRAFIMGGENVREGAELEKRGFASNKGMPRKAARKLAYAMKGGNYSAALDRYTKRTGSMSRRVGERLDSAVRAVSETVVKQGDEWVVKGEAGGEQSKKVFGRHASRKKAMKQLAAIEISKARRK